MMSQYWSDDSMLFSLVKEKLFVALVGDVMDTMGLHHQFLNSQFKPIDPQMVIIGRAMPVLAADFYQQQATGHNEISEKPFGLLFQAVDDLKKNEVFVCAGGSLRYAQWGGLMTMRALQCGAAGAVIHGHPRDTNKP